jgi:hypothetical protein
MTISLVRQQNSMRWLLLIFNSLQQLLMFLHRGSAHCAQTGRLLIPRAVSEGPALQMSNLYSSERLCEDVKMERGAW